MKCADAAMNNKVDLNLLYSGGSGGFLLLHLLLLSGKYFACFPEDTSMQEILDKQWQIPDAKNWKKSEIWPLNHKTEQANIQEKKIYFYCNPEITQSYNSKNLNLCLYTDYKSQIKLAYFKRAHWYQGIGEYYNLEVRAYKNIIKSWQCHYNNVKDPSWPDCKSFRKIKNLPESIQKELLNNAYTHHYLNYNYNNFSTLHQGQLIYKPFLPIIQQADIVIKLQDLVNSQGEILKNYLDIPLINDHQKKLLNYWCSLHPVQLLNDIGIHTTQ